jgi:asparagine synthase (glutamine-hydrolysing)
MCGIAGILNPGHDRDDLELRLRRFARDLHHRGPDDSGQFVSKNSAAGLVSTRLAIQDLSAAGHQPMTTADGRYTIVFNGEIYNFKQLRSELEADGEIFNSDSDTEVIL